MVDIKPRRPCWNQGLLFLNKYFIHDKSNKKISAQQFQKKYFKQHVLW